MYSFGGDVQVEIELLALLGIGFITAEESPPVHPCFSVTGFRMRPIARTTCSQRDVCRTTGLSTAPDSPTSVDIHLALVLHLHQRKRGEHVDFIDHYSIVVCTRRWGLGLLSLAQLAAAASTRQGSRANCGFRQRRWYRGTPPACRQRASHPAFAAANLWPPKTLGSIKRSDLRMPLDQMWSSGTSVQARPAAPHRFPSTTGHLRTMLSNLKLPLCGLPR